MTDFERLMLEKITAIEKSLAELKAGAELPDAQFEALPADAVVGKDYVAWRFGCSIRAVVRGEKGTGAIPRLSRKPLTFVRRDVDAVWRDRVRSVKNVAAKVAADARPVRRRSMIRRAA